jgi:alkyl sulfatase BDS1-like metallo-beta-lactamase superfamily hydrolase
MDNVLIVVDDLEATKAFFIELGLKLEGETTVEGPLVGKLIGLKDVRATLAMLRIRMDSRKAEGLRFTIKLVTPDNGEKFLIELENATLTNIKGYVADKPDLTLTINRSDLEQTMTGAKTLEAQIKEGTAKVQGDVSILAKLAATMVEFDPRFEIMPGTKARPDQLAKSDPYEADAGLPIAE